MPIQHRLSFAGEPAFSGELVIDNFAGGGGASTGIAAAIGRDPDIAINHDAAALAMHAANHPHTKHCCEDIWDVDPKRIADGRPIGLAWFSPDCKHFSRAKGSKPLEKRIRALAWVVVKWAKAVRPRIIFMENVREFRDWGPLGPDNLPDKARKGATYRSWRQSLEKLGYDVEDRDLNAAEYGAPTHRRRFFLVARCDGQPIKWPEPTHDETNYHSAAECIDWSIPTNSIFSRKRPLAENTMRRIALGMKKFIFEDPEPFIVRTGHYSNKTGEGGKYFRGQSVQDPLATVCAQGNDKALVVPYAVDIAHYSKDGRLRGQDLKKPLGSVVAHTAEKALVVPKVEPADPQPFIVNVSHSDPDNFRGQSLEDPMETICAKWHNKALVLPHITQFFGGMVGKRVDEPVPTVTSWDHNALVAAFLSKYYGTNVGSSLRDPAPTVTAQGNKLATVQAAVNGANDNTELVRAFLTKYYGTAIGQSIKEPLHTITTKARMGIVTLHGSDYQITDIGLRMLQPRELARAQGFRDSYILTGTKANQIAKIGNSVCPILAQRLVETNYCTNPREMRRIA